MSKPNQTTTNRSMPVGAESSATGKETHFRVWAPLSKSVEIVFEGKGRSVILQAEENGYFSGSASEGTGAKYKIALDGGEAYPDPVSRYQPTANPN